MSEQEGEPKKPIVVGVLQSHTLLVVRYVAVSLAFVLGLIATARLLTPGLLVLMPVSLLLVIFYLLRATGRPRRETARGRLGVFNGSVNVEGRPLVERASLTSGAVIPTSPDGTLVRLERRLGPPIDLAVADVPTGQTALARLGLDAGHAVARFRVLSMDVSRWKRNLALVTALALGMIVVMPVFVGLKMPWLVGLYVPLVVAVALSTVWPSRIVVGADGVSWSSLGRAWFLSFDGVVDVEIVERKWLNAVLVVAQLLDARGEVQDEILVDQRKNGPFQEGVHAEIAARAEGLAQRIREALELRAAPRAELDRAALARGAREIDAWLAHLRGLLAGSSTFRDAGPPTAQALLAIVEDASARPVDRAAAAVALSHAEPAIKQRMRVAAEASAAPKLRIALDAVVEGTLDEQSERVAAALEELEQARDP